MAALRNSVCFLSEFRVSYKHRSDALLLPASPDWTGNTSSSRLLVSIKNPAHLLPRRVSYFLNLTMMKTGWSC